ncbi:UPF0109 protein YlqC [Weizmannia acidilactici]|uniref:RNA-binding protein KhpA n=1 Tax=Weizmannia acidilactici TaxID=2607726 RepID=A0A5J4JBE6_9BACI|nr:UPF0109 protein YlqC [Weizmannia acidilactici]GER69071.1 UPF0109 protein YlqC [Weizmannia acidilactici]GER71956.1 UPF0109 protein YlqC [Weizmannia acidilactici]
MAIVRPIVGHPDDVRVEWNEEETETIYRLFVHPDDIGKVIGKKGRTAKAIRTVVYAAAGAHGHKKIHLEIAD